MASAPYSDGGIAERLSKALARPPSVEGILLDPAYFAGFAGPGEAPRMILSNGHRWRAGDEARPNVPLQLCELLAYKTALAYSKPAEIERYLSTCCEGVERFCFFDSTASGPGAAAADAQGYGFVRERKAFIVFRGTQTDKDWGINTADALTDQLGGTADQRYLELKARYGDLVDRLGERAPGRHVGFSIAWAALKDQVEDWLADALEANGADAIEGMVYSGHSLGGAMAQLAAFDHARIEERLGLVSRIGAVVTFGAPAVGGTALARHYQRLLGDRTVLLESSGDLVPRIMDRWYYRWLYPLRQRAAAGVQLHLQEHAGFAKVATPWQFASEPPMSSAEIDKALRLVARSIEQAAKEVRGQEAARSDLNKKDPAAAEKPGTGEPATAKPQAPATESAGGAKPVPGGETPNWVYWLVIGAIVVAAAGIGWYFVRRKLFAHDIEQRYALYLSTLSYQQLRAAHGGDLARANAALDEHLRFVRGDVEQGGKSDGAPIYASVKALPVRIDARRKDLQAFADYLEHADTFV